MENGTIASYFTRGSRFVCLRNVFCNSLPRRLLISDSMTTLSATTYSRDRDAVHYGFWNVSREDLYLRLTKQTHTSYAKCNAGYRADRKTLTNEVGTSRICRDPSSVICHWRFVIVRGFLQDCLVKTLAEHANQPNEYRTNLHQYLRSAQRKSHIVPYVHCRITETVESSRKDALCRDMPSWDMLFKIIGAFALNVHSSGVLQACLAHRRLVDTRKCRNEGRRLQYLMCQARRFTLSALKQNESSNHDTVFAGWTDEVPL